MGVGPALTLAVAVLSLFVVVSGTIAIFSFKEFHRNFDRLASTQTNTLIAAAKLQQESEALAGYAPKLFAKGLDQTSLMEFSVEVYAKQASLQALIDELIGYVGESGSIATIKETSAALFQNIDTLSTEVFAKAAAEDGLRVRARQDLRDVFRCWQPYLRHRRRGLAGRNPGGRSCHPEPADRPG